MYAFGVGCYSLWGAGAGIYHLSCYLQTHSARVLALQLLKWGAVVVKSAFLLSIWVGISGAVRYVGPGTKLFEKGRQFPFLTSGQVSVQQSFRIPFAFSPSSLLPPIPHFSYRSLVPMPFISILFSYFTQCFARCLGGVIRS